MVINHFFYNFQTLDLNLPGRTYLEYYLDLAINRNYGGHAEVCSASSVFFTKVVYMGLYL